MPVDAPSSDYEAMMARWKRCRDCYEGEHAVKAAGTSYLPALEGHDPTTRTDEYWSYVDRALFYNAFGRAVEGLVGMVFRKPPVVTVPTQADPLIDDVDLMGRSLIDFAQVLLTEGLQVARRGVLVDHTGRGEHGARSAIAARPYMALYATEQILDTLYDTDLAGVRRLMRVRLKEQVEKPSDDDEFATDVEERVRVLELFDEQAVEGEPPDSERLIYRQRIFVLVHGEGPNEPDRYEEAAEQPPIPLLDGEPLKYIPFWSIGIGSALVLGEAEAPPLLDLADVNISHYRTMADIENAAHMAGVPTPVFTGTTADSEIRLGTTRAIVIEQPEARALILSYGGEGLAALENRAANKEQMMAFLGARMLQPDKRGIESAETARIHRMGEVSVLGTLANHQSRNMTEALRLLLQWAGIRGFETAEIRLNDDYMPVKIDPQMIAAMRETWVAGGISYETFWMQLQEGEVAPSNVTAEEERAKIEADQAKERAIAQAEREIELAAQVAAGVQQPLPPGAQEQEQVTQDEAA